MLADEKYTTHTREKSKQLIVKMTGSTDYKILCVQVNIKL